MCLHLFSPGKKLVIIYAAESISICRGAVESRIDLLVKNGSESPLERMHACYPHPVPIKRSGENTKEESDDGKFPGKPGFADRTDTFFDQNSGYNIFYQINGCYLVATMKDTGEANVKVSMSDPNDPLKLLEYEGQVCGKTYVTPYQVTSDENLTTTQWKFLSAMGWSVFTLTFETPIQPGEKRWIRLRGKSGFVINNTGNRLVRWINKWLLDGIWDTFEIAGPNDIKHRIMDVLRMAAISQAGTDPVLVASMTEFQGLQKKLLTHGLISPGTNTDIEDWRVNIFVWTYMLSNLESYWGDIKPVGGLRNVLQTRGNRYISCFQFKAGTFNMNSLHQGRFGVRISAREASLIKSFLPWVAFVLSLIALLMSSDVREWILSLFPVAQQ